MKIKWYHRDATLVIAFFILGFLMMPLVWFNPKFSIKSKTFWTIIILAITFIFVKPIVSGYLLPREDLLLIESLTQ